MNRVALDSMEKGNYDKAINYILDAEKIYPTYDFTRRNKIYYYNIRGHTYLSQKDYPLAIKIYKEAINAMKTDTDTELLRKNLNVAYYNYALSENRSKRYSNVSSILNEALLFFPNDERFINLKNKLPKQ